MSGDVILPFAVDLFVKSTGVLVLGFLVLAGWKWASAAQRDCVWCLVFVMLLALPVTRLVSPFWALSWEESVPVQVTHHQEVMAPVSATPEAVAPVEIPQVVAPSWPRQDPMVVLIGAWLMGATLLLSYRVMGSWLLYRCWCRSSLLPDGACRELASSVVMAYGLRRTVAIRFSRDCMVPVTWGTWRPVVLLPVEALHWPEDRLRSALYHELAHVRNFDHLKRWLSSLACALYWPHPLVWLAGRRFHLAQEEASDNLVLRGGVAPQDYAAQLIEVIRMSAGRRRSSLPVLAMARRSTVEGRIAAILDESRNRESSGRGLVAVGIGLALVLGALLGMAQVRARAADVPVVTDGAVSTTTGNANVELEFKLILIDEKTYVEQRVTIDKAVATNNQAFLLKLQSTALIQSLLLKDGQSGSIQTIRAFSYATNFDKDKDGKVVPSDFKSRDLGLSVVATPKLTADQRNMDLAFYVRLINFEGWKETAPGVRQPVLYKYSISSKWLMGPKGAAIWLGLGNPGVRASQNHPPDGVDPGDDFTLRDDKTPKRPLVLVSWRKVLPEPVIAVVDAKGLMVKTSITLFQISQQAYAEQPVAIDEALQLGDAKFLEGLPQFRLLGEPTVLAKMGEQAVIEAMHPIPYPPGFNVGGEKTRNCGIRVVLTPSLVADGTLSLNLFPEITSYTGSIKNALGQEDPIWNVRRLNAKIALSRGKPYGLWAFTGETDMSKIMSWVGPKGAHEDIFNPDTTPVRIGMIVTTDLYVRDGEKLP